MTAKEWKIFRGSKSLASLPPPPPWRRFNDEKRKTGSLFQISEEEVELINAAIYLRRPLLVTGPPGTGKSSLAYAIAHELQLGSVLVWAINSRTTLRDGLYLYDAIDRLQQMQINVGEQRRSINEMTDNLSLEEISNFLRLGPVGTAFAPSSKREQRVLLIDEIDKSDIDLPNDLLHLFEDGRFEISELARSRQNFFYIKGFHGEEEYEIKRGLITCDTFPITIITSNGERELPAPFMRRCIHLEMKPPTEKMLMQIVKAHLEQIDARQQTEIERMIANVVERRQNDEYVSTDQLLNAAYLLIQGFNLEERMQQRSEQIEKSLEDFILNTISFINFDG